MKIVSGLFETYQEADSAVKALNLDGYNSQNISVIAQEEVFAHDQNQSAAAGGGRAGIGGIVGLIVGTVPFAIPGIGLVIGAAGGGTIGVIRKWFGSEDRVAKIKHNLKDGHILVAIRTGSTRGDVVEQTLRDYGAYITHQHAVEPERVLS